MAIDALQRIAITRLTAHHITNVRSLLSVLATDTNDFALRAHPVTQHASCLNFLRSVGGGDGKGKTTATLARAHIPMM